MLLVPLPLLVLVLLPALVLPLVARPLQPLSEPLPVVWPPSVPLLQLLVVSLPFDLLPVARPPQLLSEPLPVALPDYFVLGAVLVPKPQDLQALDLVLGQGLPPPGSLLPKL